MQEAQSALGFTRTPSEDDPRRDPQLLVALERIAPGTGLRQAIDDVIRSREGALIVVGDPEGLKFLYSGGIRLDQPFTPQLLYELSKMDGAIVVDPKLTKLAYANVQLMPDPTIPSNETGTRHRTAERVAKQTGALVISISQQRSTISVYTGPARYQLDPVPEVLAKTNQALAALHALPYRHLLEFERLGELLGHPHDVNPLDYSVSPRGFRVLSHIPRLPDQIVKRVVTDMDGLEAIVRASQRDLEAIAGVGAVRAREIREGLRRLQEHNLVDRYLQLQTRRPRQPSGSRGY